MDIHGENAFKIKSYSNAAYTLDRLNDPLVDMTPAQIASIRGIGDAIAQKIVDLLATKKLQILEDYIEKTPAGILEMLKIKGLGPKKIITIWKELGIESIGELLYACEENRLINYKGFGAKTQQSIQDALNYYLQNQGSFLYQQVQDIVAQIENALSLQFPKDQHQVSGHYKRQMETLDFLDIITTTNNKILLAWLEEKGFICDSSNDYLSCKGPDQFELRWHIVAESQFFIQDFSLSCSPEFWLAWQALPNFDATKAFEETTKRGAKPFMEPTREEDENGYVIRSGIYTYGETVHIFVERSNYTGVFLPGYKTWKSHYNPETVGLKFIDHMVGNVGWNQMDVWVKWYEDVMGFENFLSFDDKQIHTEYSALMSKVMSNGNGRIKFPINEPAEEKKRSQIEEYLDFYEGAGVQHIAVATDDIIKTVHQLKSNGVEFLSTPPETYYKAVPGRLEEFSHELREDLEKLKRLGIMIDADEEGYLLQIFTKPVEDRPTLFFEVIQRMGARGFGAGNFKALFESIEREQAKRGTL